jgi:TraB/PrgY/gumN family
LANYIIGLKPTLLITSNLNILFRSTSPPFNQSEPAGLQRDKIQFAYCSTAIISNRFSRRSIDAYYFQVLFALNQTLTQYESRRSGFVPPLSSIDDGLSPLYTADDLVHQYNCGDLNTALFMPSSDASSSTGNGHAGERTTSSDAIVARQINDYFRYELIDKRNRRMAERIDRLLSERPRTSFFFAFGAGQNCLCLNRTLVTRFTFHFILFICKVQHVISKK